MDQACPTRTLETGACLLAFTPFTFILTDMPPRTYAIAVCTWVAMYSIETVAIHTFQC